MTVSGPLLVKNGLIIDPASGSAERRDVLIVDGRITAIGPPGAITPSGGNVHDASDCLILPGLINCHTHGHANLVKGVADRWTLEASLTNGPWLGGARDPDTMYVSTLLGAAEMVSKGCTACFDLVYEFPHPTPAGFAAVARAYADVGMRAVLAPMIADLSLFHAIPGLLAALPQDLRDAVGRFALDGDRTIAAVEEIAAERHKLPAGISLAIAPTIAHHCTERFLHQCMAIADRYGLPIHMHIAESRLQLIAAHKLWGMSPVRYLAERGVLRPGFVAAHAIWLTDDDLDILAGAGAAVAHVPASNLRLGSGVAQVRSMLERGLTVGLATDGSNSSDSLNMLTAMRLASYLSRAFAGSRDRWLSAAETVRLGTRCGADLLGLKHAGRIEQDADADLVFLSLDSIDFVPLNDPVNQLVTCADSASIKDVMIGGRFVLRDGRVVPVDMRNLRQQVSAAVDRLRHATAGAKALASQIEPHVVAFADSLFGEPLGIERLLAPSCG